MSPVTRFVLWMLGFDLLGFTVGAMVAPPDPTVQVYYVGVPTLLVAPALAYLMVFRGGEDRLRAALGRPPDE